MKRNRWLSLLILTSVSRIAHAHGEDVLISIYAELVSIGLCIAFLFFWPQEKPYRVIGFIGCLAGVVAGNWVFLELPY